MFFLMEVEEPTLYVHCCSVMYLGSCNFGGGGGGGGQA